MAKRAYLCGPFFGEPSWEYFRYAPYIIHLSKLKTHDIIVFTREDRFDLYGSYATKFIPLNINEKGCVQRSFTLGGKHSSELKKISDVFRIKFKKEYDKVEQLVPDFNNIRSELKWQFPRNKMDYDFQPRIRNKKMTDRIITDKKIIVVNENYNYTNRNYFDINIKDFKNDLKSHLNKKITYFGCLIELIKRSSFVISDLESDLGKLALLLKVPLIYPNREMTLDSVRLLNPLNTMIIDCMDIEYGVEIYQNYLKM